MTYCSSRLASYNVIAIYMLIAKIFGIKLMVSCSKAIPSKILWLSAVQTLQRPDYIGSTPMAFASGMLKLSNASGDDKFDALHELFEKVNASEKEKQDLKKKCAFFYEIIKLYKVVLKLERDARAREICASKRKFCAIDDRNDSDDVSKKNV